MELIQPVPRKRTHLWIIYRKQFSTVRGSKTDFWRDSDHNWEAPGTIITKRIRNPDPANHTIPTALEFNSVNFQACASVSMDSGFGKSLLI